MGKNNILLNSATTTKTWKKLSSGSFEQRVSLMADKNYSAVRGEAGKATKQENKSEVKTEKDREKILQRKYKIYGLNRDSTAPSSGSTTTTTTTTPTCRATTSSSYEIHEKRSGEKIVAFDDDEKASYARLESTRKRNKGSLLSRLKKLVLQEKEENLDDEEDSYVGQWEDEEDEEDVIESPRVTSKLPMGLDFGKDELTRPQ